MPPTGLLLRYGIPRVFHRRARARKSQIGGARPADFESDVISDSLRCGASDPHARARIERIEAHGVNSLLAAMTYGSTRLRSIVNSFQFYYFSSRLLTNWFPYFKLFLRRT